MLTRNFNDELFIGRTAETRIARWLREKRGCTVIPVYEIAEQQFKGPQIFTPDCELIAPDMIVYGRKGASFVEAKCKSVFTWYRKKQQWETGIDLHHYGQYIAVSSYVPWPVQLLFLHTRSTPDPRDLAAGCPTTCPTGLFGRCLNELRQLESHRAPADQWGKGGMVYWPHSKLHLYAPLEAVR